MPNNSKAPREVHGGITTPAGKGSHRGRRADDGAYSYRSPQTTRRARLSIPFPHACQSALVVSCTFFPRTKCWFWVCGAAMAFTWTAGLELRNGGLRGSSWHTDDEDD